MKQKQMRLGKVSKSNTLSIDAKLYFHVNKSTIPGGPRFL